jgi:hypothetical protein
MSGRSIGRASEYPEWCGRTCYPGAEREGCGVARSRSRFRMARMRFRIARTRSRITRLLMPHSWHAWLRRGVLAAVLAAVAFAPGQASGAPSPACGASRCGTVGTVLWAQPLPGTWSAASSLQGTVPASPAGGQAYAAAGTAVAAVGFGMIVYAYSARTGAPLWDADMTGFPDGAQIVSVRVWPGVVTVGVSSGPLLGAAGSSQATVVLSAGTGRRVREYPSAPFGGAVAASSRATVVVGPTAVTSYVNATGRVSWRRTIGAVGQDWRSDGGHLYVAGTSGGDLGAGPVTSVRRISLRTGAEQTIRPPGGSFDGQLAAVLRGIVLFSSGTGVSAYDGTTGLLLWRRAAAVPQNVDVVRGVFYLAVGTTLVGVQPASGRVVARVPGADGSGSSGVYGVRDGVALGIDLGPAGQVWGYDVRSQRVIWTTRTLPWPHYFVDLSGIGGSMGPGSGTVLLAACTQRDTSTAADTCQHPELVLIQR